MEGNNKSLMNDEMKPSIVDPASQALFQKRIGERPKDAMQLIGLPANHAPIAMTYQDLLSPPATHGSFPLPIENADRHALKAAARKGHAMAKRALAQLERQSKQHVLSTNERSSLAQCFAHMVQQHQS